MHSGGAGTGRAQVFGLLGSFVGRDDLYKRDEMLLNWRGEGWGAGVVNWQSELPELLWEM